MGGLFGGGGGKAVEKMAEEKLPVAQAVEKTSGQKQEEADMARRRARRGGRALLSDARLNPEQGVTTLGQSGM